MEGNLRHAVFRASCGVWGHVVDNEVFRHAAGGARRCRCGSAYLPEDGTTTHVRHTLSCFLRHHTYARLADRDGVHEYVCVRCGHPLVYPEKVDPFADRELFGKKVRYLCGLLGHRVHAVATRDGFTEYACHCGHSFLKPERGARIIRHPLRCFFRAHRIRFLARRCGFAEYVCTDCGHPFCFADPGHRQAQTNSDGHRPTQTNTDGHRTTQTNTVSHRKTRTNTDETLPSGGHQIRP